jgi:predicted transcriptional regulator
MDQQGEIDIKGILEDLFLREKPAKILITLKNSQKAYATSVAKAVDCTYSHTTKVLDQLRDLGLVEFDKQGRVKMLKLTPEGEEIAEHLDILIKKFMRLKNRISSKQAGEDIPEDEEPGEQEN